MSEILQKFGTKLRLMRLDKALSQQDLAECIGADKSYISGLENGTRNPTLTTLQRICEVLETNLSELLSD